jgi:transposase-like protein
MLDSVCCDLGVGDQAGGSEHQRWNVEYRCRAVLEVLNGVPVAQVARQAGASR